MTANLKEYEEIVGASVVDDLRALAGWARSRRCQHINSTSVGGDVAAILSRLVPLMRELGVETTWDVIKGDEHFLAATRALSQALEGGMDVFTEAMRDCYRAAMETNLKELQFGGDVIFIHDPQPAGLIVKKNEIGRRWVWRSHLDLSAPDEGAWEFFAPFLEGFDASIFSMPDFARSSSLPQFVIPPSIDPLGERNRELEPGQVREIMEQHGIDPARPVVMQVARFDRLRDPIGVLAVYRLIKPRHDCQLVILGDGAVYDQNSLHLLSEVQSQAENDSDVHVLALPPFSDLDINGLVRGATVVVHKPIREGFGLAVSEAMWKRKPVVGSAVGGVKRQIVNGHTGFLVHSAEEAALRVSQLLADADMRTTMGENGREYVRHNFLVTRQLEDYLLLMLALDYPDKDVVFLA
jgi:trehalose synthase